MKRAVVIGSTGMVGVQLIELLLEDDDYSEVLSLVRRKSGIIHPKLKELIIDFDQPETWREFVKGDTLFSTLGTTIAQAKTKENQFKVDFTYQFNVAAIAACNGIQSYVLVSSAGANENSTAFYMNMKGKLEKAIQSLPFDFISVIQPGPLTGFRANRRLGEVFAINALALLNSLGVFRKYRPIDARIVAKAMINAVKKKKTRTYTLEEVFELAS